MLTQQAELNYPILGGSKVILVAVLTVMISADPVYEQREVLADGGQQRVGGENVSQFSGLAFLLSPSGVYSWR